MTTQVTFTTELTPEAIAELQESPGPPPGGLDGSRARGADRGGALHAGDTLHVERLGPG